MREKLTKLIEKAKWEHANYCFARALSPTGQSEDYVTEASFIAEALIEAGVCFRLSAIKEG